MRKIDTIVIHCSAVEYGDVSLYREWHLARKFNDIGYHFVILNAYPKKSDYDNKKPVIAKDGVIEIGRDIKLTGAHVKNHNKGSIGICLVGDRVFSSKQLESLKSLVKTLKSIYDIKEIHAHYEYDTAKAQGKTCPNIDIDYLKEYLEE